MSSSPKTDSRNSRGSLPLPTTLSTASTTSSPNLSYQTTSTRIPVSSSPTSAHFPLQGMHSPPAQNSSTHAGGIQPSSSFFRPARPIQPLQYPHEAPVLDITDPKDQYPLTTLNNSATDHQNRSSFGHSSGEDFVTDTTEDQHIPPKSPKRPKQSREPLIPASSSSYAPKPSVSATSPATSPHSSPTKAVGGRTRTSLDRVFGLSFPTRMSLDSIRHRNNAPFDEERAERPHAFTKFSHKTTADSPTTRSFNTQPIPEPYSPSRSLAPSRTSGASPERSTPTPAPSFIAIPPTPTPGSRYPLAHTPRSQANSSKPLRKYALHPSRNRFLLSGRLLTGGDTPYAFISTLTLFVGLSGLFFGTTCVFWWHHSAGGKAIVIIGAYLAALVLSAMLTTATTDPGIMPRGLDPDPPYPATSPSDGGVRVPMPRDLRVRSEVVRVKYCPTCKTYRPPRSSHCKICDNCVDGCDHHCQWVNNCIGRRNYTTFFALLCAAATTLLLIIITSALHIWLLTTTPTHQNFLHALRNNRSSIGSAVVFCLGVAVIWPVTALLLYHARLLLLNVTTIEMIRNQAHKTIDLPGVAMPLNPFSYGTKRRNFMSVLCRTQGFSWLDAHAVATEDLRELNPGMHGVADTVRAD